MLVLTTGIPNSDTNEFEPESDCTVGKSQNMDPDGYPHQV